MYSLQKFISGILVILLFFVSGNTSLFANELKENTIQITFGSSFDTCNIETLHCEKIDEKTYHCEKNSGLKTSTSSCIREIPTGGSSQSIFINGRFERFLCYSAPRRIGGDYENPEKYCYPFVRIIKIQV